MLFGPVPEIGDCGNDSVRAVTVKQRGQSLLTGFQGTDLGPDITDPFIRYADVVEDDIDHILLQFSCTHQFDRRQAQSLLLDLGCG